MRTPAGSRLGFVVAMLALQAGAWYFARHTFLDLHGMHEWPTVLAVVSAVLITVAGLADFRKLPKNALAGYVLGFAAARFFAGDGVDPGGGATSNAWLIWGGVFALLCLRGIIATVLARTVRSRW